MIEPWPFGFIFNAKSTSNLVHLKKTPVTVLSKT